jgi:hypothetical protein
MIRDQTGLVKHISSLECWKFEKRIKNNIPQNLREGKTTRKVPPLESRPQSAARTS